VLREETDPATLWRWYIQLIAAEAAFRTAKSDHTRSVRLNRTRKRW